MKAIIFSILTMVISPVFAQTDTSQDLKRIQDSIATSEAMLAEEEAKKALEMLEFGNFIYGDSIEPIEVPNLTKEEIWKEAEKKFDPLLNYKNYIELAENCPMDNNGNYLAIYYYTKAIELNNSCEICYINRAQREEKTDIEGAKLDLKKAMKINPYCFVCYEKMAYLYCWGDGKRNYPLARNYYYKSLKNLKCNEENLNKQSSLIENISMTYYLELGHNDKGLKKSRTIKIHILDSFVRINPLNEYFIARADIKRDEVLKDYKGALADYKHVYNNKGHTNYHVLWNIAYCNLSLLDYTEALKYYKKAIDVLEQEEQNGFTLERISKLYFSKGDCKMNLEDYRGAIEDYQTSLSKLLLSEKDGPAHFLSLYINLGKAKLLLSDFSGGIIELKKAIQYDNYSLSLVNGDVSDYVDLAYAYYLLGYGYIKLSDINQACSAWSKSGDLGHKEAYTAIKEYCTK